MTNNADLLKRRRHAQYLSHRRGTKELDLILGAFAERYVAAFDSAALDEYEEILTLDDADLWAWLTSNESIPESLNRPVMKLLLKMKYSE